MCLCMYAHRRVCVCVCAHMHTGGRNRCMEHGRPEHPGTTTLSMASLPLSSQLPFWSAPLSPPSIRHPHSRDPHLLVFSRTSTFFRSSKFSVEQDSTLQKREKKKNPSFIRGASTKPGWRQVGFREKINREAATLGRLGRELGQPELGQRVTQKKKKKEISNKWLNNGKWIGTVHNVNVLCAEDSHSVVSDSLRPDGL